MSTLETKRLILRRFTCDDWQDLHEYLSQEQVVRYEPYNVYTEEESKEEARYRSESDAFWAVCLKENNKLIGNLYFQQHQPQEFMTWQIGYVFNPAYYGNGYATEACQRILKYGFEELNAHRITGKCNPDNTASWRLMERLAMRREGHFKKEVFFKRTPDGKPIWNDGYQYSILKEEWVKTSK